MFNRLARSMLEINFDFSSGEKHLMGPNTLLSATTFGRKHVMFNRLRRSMREINFDFSSGEKHLMG